MSIISEYLTMCAGFEAQYNNRYYTTLLQEGREYLKLNRYLSGLCRKHYRLKNKECFYNAQKLALENPGEYAYCEGIALSVIPLEHAWVITPDEEVVDPTWHPNKQEVPEYFGITLPSEFIREWWLKTHTANPLLGVWWTTGGDVSELKEEKRRGRKRAKTGNRNS